MAQPNNPKPFSLRPWPVADKRPKNLAEFVTRIYEEDGPEGFQKLDQTKLRQEIEARKQGTIQDDSSDTSSEDGSTQETEQPKSIEALRGEVLEGIQVALTNASSALECVSLLLSKEQPVQAGTTISEGTRQLVPIGTLGASRLKEPNVTPAQVQEETAIATGLRIMGTNKMVDSVMAAAKRLEKEMELEAKYWADILAVSEDGWAICSLPQEPHTLGVRYGFAESAPKFRNNSIAPLRRNADGAVHLGLGPIGGGSQRVRLTIKRGDTIVDQSPLPARIQDNAPLSDRVREARNTIWHQELWFELNREARSLLAYHVFYDGPSIVWKQNEQITHIYTLEDLGEPDSTHMDLSTRSCSCTASWSYMQFLLWQGHRQNYNRRTNFAPLPAKAETVNYPFSIIRAVIARIMHFDETKLLDKFLDDLVTTMRAGGISTAFYTSRVSDVDTSLHHMIEKRRSPKLELNWTNMMVGGLSTKYILAISARSRIWVCSRVSVAAFIGTFYRITLHDPDQPDPEGQESKNPLKALYAPAPETVYPNLMKTRYYLRQASVRAVAHKVASDVSKKLARDDVKVEDGWQGTSIISDNGKRAVVAISDDDGRLTISMEGHWVANGAVASHHWTWTADGEGEGGESMESALLKIMEGRV
ncbi:subunit 17 of mediator complex-domain-containing protein [Xylariaceae sp. FL0016]|nr:subunit 17 of mediator complex-domain-containing protein [Xylariaceae sp. FL0016]